MSQAVNSPEVDSAQSTTVSPAERRERAGKTVVITGAGAGIGRAAAELFASRGARIALTARGEAGLRGAADAVTSLGGDAPRLPADAADFEAVDEAASRAEAELGPIDEPPGSDEGALGEFDRKSRTHSKHDITAELAESAGSAVTRAFGSLITTAKRKRR